VLAPNVVELYVDPVRGRLQHGLGQIAGRLVANDMVDTDLLEKGALGRTAGQSDDGVPIDLSDLRDDRAHGTGRSRS
jgi:hypothetical protein